MMSEIDPVQNSSVDAFLVKSAGCTANTGACTGTITPAAETAKWTPACGMTPLVPNPTITTYNTCYPPAVDYTPTYYLINGQSFDRTNPGGSAITPGATTCTPTCTATTPPSTATLLPRFLNPRP